MGGWFSHMKWLYLEKNPRVKLAGQSINISDLESMFEVRLHKKIHFIWNPFIAFILPAIISNCLYGESMLNGFLILGVLRYTVILHATGTFNSLSHLYGKRPNKEDIQPANNPIVNIISLGEGDHNFHHTYPFDYANSEYEWYEHFNMGKMVIDFFEKIGLAYNLKQKEKSD